MKLTDSVTVEDVTLHFSASMKEQIKYDLLRDVWEIDDQAHDSFYRYMFLLIAAHCDEVTGLKWKPVAFNADKAQMEKSYQAFLEQTNQMLFWNAQACIQALQGPIASLLERPDETLTDEQKKTEN